MKTIFLLLLVVLALSSLGVMDTDRQVCGQGCSTIIKVLDCNSDPVANAQITIKLCCNQETYSATTDAEGKATFPYCVEDICERTIRMNLPSTRSTEYRMDGCSSGKNSECTVKVCSGPTILIDADMTTHREFPVPGQAWAYVYEVRFIKGTPVSDA